MLPKLPGEVEHQSLAILRYHEERYSKGRRLELPCHREKCRASTDSMIYKMRTALFVYNQRTTLFAQATHNLHFTRICGLTKIAKSLLAKKLFVRCYLHIQYRYPARSPCIDQQWFITLGNLIHNFLRCPRRCILKFFIIIKSLEVFLGRSK